MRLDIQEFKGLFTNIDDTTRSLSFCSDCNKVLFKGPYVEIQNNHNLYKEQKIYKLDRCPFPIYDTYKENIDIDIKLVLNNGDLIVVDGRKAYKIANNIIDYNAHPYKGLVLVCIKNIYNITSNIVIYNYFDGEKNIPRWYVLEDRLGKDYGESNYGINEKRISLAAGTTYFDNGLFIRLPYDLNHGAVYFIEIDNYEIKKLEVKKTIITPIYDGTGRKKDEITTVFETVEYIYLDTPISNNSKINIDRFDNSTAIPYHSIFYTNNKENVTFEDLVTKNLPIDPDKIFKEDLLHNGIFTVDNVWHGIIDVKGRSKNYQEISLPYSNYFVNITQAPEHKEFFEYLKKRVKYRAKMPVKHEDYYWSDLAIPQLYTRRVSKKNDLIYDYRPFHRPFVLIKTYTLIDNTEYIVDVKHFSITTKKLYADTTAVMHEIGKSLYIDVQIGDDFPIDIIKINYYIAMYPYLATKKYDYNNRAIRGLFGKAQLLDSIELYKDRTKYGN